MTAPRHCPTPRPLSSSLWRLSTNTPIRFALLAIFVVSLTYDLYTHVPFTIIPALTQLREEAERCLIPSLLETLGRVITPYLKLGPEGSRSDMLHELNRNLLFEGGSIIHRCGAPWASHVLLWQFGGVGLLLGVAGLFYWYGPRWTIWRSRLQPLTVEALVAKGIQRDDADALVRCLLQLSNDRTKYPGLLAFWWDPDDKLKVNAFTFGRLRHYEVALNTALVLQFRDDRPTFEAMVRHELAHVQNRDVDLRAGTVALYDAFLLVALTPATLLMLYTGSWNMAMSTSIGLAAIIFLTRQAIYRSREFWADLRVADSIQGYSQVLRSLEEEDEPSRRRPWWSPASFVHDHAALAQRRAMVEHPRLLCRAGFWEAAGLGLATTIVAQEMASGLATLTIIPLPQLVQVVTSFSKDGVGILIFGLLIGGLLSVIAMPMGVVGLGLWRMTLAAVLSPPAGGTDAGGHGTPRGLPSLAIVGRTLAWLRAQREEPWMGVLLSALGLTVGLVGGNCLSFLRLQTSLAETVRLPGMAQVVGFELGWSVLFVGCLLLFLRWVVAGATVWIEVALTQETPGSAGPARPPWLRRVCHVGLCVGFGVLACWVVPFLGTYTMFQPIFYHTPQLVPMLQTLGLQPWTLAFGMFLTPMTLARHVGVWAFPIALMGLLCLLFPLAAWRWHRHVSEPPEGAGLPRRYPPGREHSAALRPGLTMLTGLLGGLVGVVGLRTVWLEVARAVLDAKQSLPQDVLLYLLFAPVWLLAGGVAAVVGTLMRRLPVVHGLCAAVVTAVVVWGGLVGLHALRLSALPAVHISAGFFIYIAHGSVLSAMLAAGLAARLSTFGRARGAGVAGAAVSATPVPPTLPHWNWGAVFLPWLWALRYKAYGVFWGWVPVLALSLAIGLWGITHMLHSILGWFVPLLVLSLVFPWLVPFLVLSLALEVWGLDSLRAATPLPLLTMLVLGAVATYACALLLPFSGRRGNAWAWQAQPWMSEAQFHRVQQRWATWGLGGLTLGLCLVALTGFLAFPPVAPHHPILFQPIFRWADATETRGGIASFILVPAGSAPPGAMVAVTKVPGLQGHTTPLRDVHGVDIRSQALVATFTRSWGRPGDGPTFKPLDLTSDYFLMLADTAIPRTLALELDARAQPLVGERIWFPNRTSAAKVGYQLVSGTVVQTHTNYVTIRLHTPIFPEWQGGSPVLSRLTGKVIGIFTGWESKEGEVLDIYLTPSWAIRRALATPHDLLPFDQLPTPPAAASLPPTSAPREAGDGQQTALVARQGAAEPGGKEGPRAAPPGRGWLGVHVQKLTFKLRQEFQVPASLQGVLVTEVVPATPAHHAGITRGDLLVAFQGKAVQDAESFVQQVQAAPPGTVVEVGLFRDGTPRTVQVTLGRLPDDGQAPVTRIPPAEVEALLGVHVQQEQRELIVGSVTPEGPAARAGLRPHDVIRAVNRTAVPTLDAYHATTAALDPATLVLFLLERQGEILYVAVRPGPAR